MRVLLFFSHLLSFMAGKARHFCIAMGENARRRRQSGLLTWRGRLTQPFQPSPLFKVLSAVITAQKPNGRRTCNLSVLFALTLPVGLPKENEFLGKLDRPSMTPPVLPPVVRPSVSRGLAGCGRSAVNQRKGHWARGTKIVNLWLVQGAAS